MPSQDELLIVIWNRIDRMRTENPRRLAALALATAVVVAIVSWYFRPWLHGIVYGLYTTPILLLAVVLAAAAGLLVSSAVGPVAGGRVALVILGLIAVVGIGGTGLLAGETLGKATIAQADTAPTLSETDATKPRVVPKSVATRYASNTLNFPQYRISGGDITVRNGTPYWSYALAPDGAFNHSTGRYWSI